MVHAGDFHANSPTTHIHSVGVVGCGKAERTVGENRLYELHMFRIKLLGSYDEWHYCSQSYRLCSPCRQFFFLHYDKARWLFRLLSHPITPLILHHFLPKNTTTTRLLASGQTYSSITTIPIDVVASMLEEEYCYRRVTEYMRNDWSSGRKERHSIVQKNSSLPLTHPHTDFLPFFSFIFYHKFYHAHT